MKLTIKKIESVLKSLDVDVFDQFYFDDKETLYGFLSYKLVIHFEVDCPDAIYISFHVNSEPEYTSYIIMNLYEKLGSKGINIMTMESFAYDPEGNFLTGEEAYKAFEEETHMEIISNFMHRQAQMKYLMDMKGYRA